MRRTLTALLALVLVTAACSDDDESSEARRPSTEGTTTTAAAAPGCDPALPAEAGETRLTLTSSGQERSLLQQVPEGYDGERPAPLILNFHGFGSNAAQQALYSRLPERAGEIGAVVVTPDGTGQRQAWNLTPGGNDVQFVGDLIDDLSSRLCIDEARVYSTGISNGSALSAILACELNDRLAAVALVASTVAPVRCEPPNTMALLAFHGVDDRVVPYEGGAVNSGGAFQGIEVDPVEDSVAAWAEQNGCDSEPEEERIEPDVRHRTYTGCQADVELYSVEGAGHVWPGSIDNAPLQERLGDNTDTVDATEIILAFFEAHPRPN